MAFRTADRASQVLERARDAMSDLDVSDTRAVRTLRSLVDDAQDFLEHVGDDTRRGRGTLGRTANRALDTWSSARSALSDAGSRLPSMRDAGDGVRQVATQGRQYVGQHPLQTALLAGALGVLIVMLTRRRQGRDGYDAD